MKVDILLELLEMQLLGAVCLDTLKIVLLNIISIQGRVKEGVSRTIGTELGA